MGAFDFTGRLAARFVLPILLPSCALIAPCADAAAEPPAPLTPALGSVPGRVIIEWAPQTPRAEKTALRQEAEVSYESNLGDPAFQLVKVDPSQSVASAIKELESNPAVAVAERDGYLAPTSIPNDPLFGQEWALQNLGAGINGFSGAIAGDDIEAPRAWQRTIGTPSTVVADIDSGYRFDSPDLGPIAWEKTGEISGNGIDDDGNGYVDDVHGYDFVGEDAESPSEDADPSDDDLISGGHGVHTAGTIGAAGDNGVGITGVAQNVRIMPLRVCANSPGLGELRCPISSLIAAINYAGENGAQVANLSLSGTSKSTTELNALAENPQTLFVAAAGNDGQDNDEKKHYPCNFEPGTTSLSNVENVICVAATDQADELASFSDWGAKSVDLGAPGTEILSTYPASESFVKDDFEQNDFETRWKSTGLNGGFARSNESPLASFGISDSPETSPVANSVRSSTLASPVAVPAEYGGCQLSGRDWVSLGGGTFTIIVFKNGFSEYTFEIPNTAGSQMRSFTTAPMSGLAGSNVGIRVRYAAGASPTASSGVWLDDLNLSCYAPLSTPPAYAYLQGTSMAAPQVSGSAALLFSEKPTATVEEVRDALLSSVDPVSSLANKTTSGGRLNAARGLAWLEPPAPILSSDPPSPAENDNPRILGSTEAGTRVLFFSGAGCLGPAEQIGTAAELASPGFSVHVPDGSTEEFSTLVETHYNSSPCSTPFSYANSAKVKDTVPPGPPALTSTDPPSPAADRNPRLIGSAETGASIAIYVGSSCGGSPVASGTAAELASPGIEVAVAEDTQSQFSATATDAALNTSGCSAPITYVDVVKDEEPPQAPILLSTSPASPADEWFPRILGSAELGSSVEIFEGAGCSGGPVANGTASALGSTGIEVTVQAGVTTQFSATATDSAGNTSPCSAPISYTNTTTIGMGTVVITMPPPEGSSEHGLMPNQCTVPKLIGKTLAQAKAALRNYGCTLGKVTIRKAPRGASVRRLIVKGSDPEAGTLTFGTVSLKLGPKPKRRHR
jgi:subtilisin family serine protease